MHALTHLLYVTCPWNINIKLVGRLTMCKTLISMHLIEKKTVMLHAVKNRHLPQKCLCKSQPSTPHWFLHECNVKNMVSATTV